MKRFSPHVLLLVGLFLVGALIDAPAQTVKIHRVAMSGARISPYPAGTFPVSTGFRVVPKAMKVYLHADTNGAIIPVTSYNWTFVSVPAGSTAAIDTPTYASVRFIPDMVGQYIVKVEVNGGGFAQDTIIAATYIGLPTTGLSCNTCHPTVGPEFAKTKHATMFTRGISGQQEVEDYEGKTVGVYSKNCIKCHTTGWDQFANNGNFGYLAKQTGFDTLWYKPFTLVGGEYVIPHNDSTSVRDMNTNFPTVANVANIGCESCHGPGSAHAAAPGKATIGKSAEAGACMQCHDAPNKHRIGSYWAASSHATMPLSKEEAGRTACWPCHNGAALVDYAKNPAKPDYTKTEIIESISCVACHDPHSDANPNQLRIMTLDKLANGYVPPAGVGGKGLLCMNCHKARVDGKLKVESQMRVFGDRFYAHYSPQADMFLGVNAYEYDLGITGIGTHQGLDDGCVTCHMATRVNGSSVHSNHEMKMTDANGKDIVTSCQTCHGKAVTSFHDIKAATDYDGNGKIEAVITEIDNMLDKLKSYLPKDASGEPITMKVDYAKDSASWKAHPEWYAGTWNYYFVKNDWSHGIHNTKYAAALLRASLGKMTGVDMLDQNMPNGFDLQQNYPNPFNPSTTIKFSVSRAADVNISVYSSAGELVATLANGNVVPGNYSAKWDATNVASGMYFYRMTATVNGVQTVNLTKKMMLVK
ncbi:MAG: ammonia-forming cytochrome c nitrite reductase subunit c552 [Ignavibacteria bacterium]|nr:ammonia-forming cytochrome c nitrite reductase subunit c552 [Ignavibacteria bacterium]